MDREVAKWNDYQEMDNKLLELRKIQKHHKDMKADITAEDWSNSLSLERCEDSTTTDDVDNYLCMDSTGKHYGSIKKDSDSIFEKVSTLSSDDVSDAYVSVGQASIESKANNKNYDEHFGTKSSNEAVQRPSNHSTYQDESEIVDCYTIATVEPQVQLKLQSRESKQQKKKKKSKHGKVNPEHQFNSNNDAQTFEAIEEKVNYEVISFSQKNPVLKREAKEGTSVAPLKKAAPVSPKQNKEGTIYSYMKDHNQKSRGSIIVIDNRHQETRQGTRNYLHD